jgi:hypothetical protein
MMQKYIVTVETPYDTKLILVSNIGVANSKRLEKFTEIVLEEYPDGKIIQIVPISREIEFY